MIPSPLRQVVAWLDTNAQAAPMSAGLRALHFNSCMVAVLSGSPSAPLVPLKFPGRSGLPGAVT